MACGMENLMRTWNKPYELTVEYLEPPFLFLFCGAKWAANQLVQSQQNTSNYRNLF